MRTCLGRVGWSRLVCWSIRILSLSGVLDHGNVAIVSVNCVGHCLQTTVRKSDIVFAVGQVSVSVLLGPEVIAGVVVLDGVLPGVHGGHIGVFVDVGLVDWGGLAVGWSGSIGGGGSVSGGGLVHDNWLVGDGLVGNRGVSWSNCRGWHIGFSGWWWGWDKQGGPIFFYAGNEGVIEAFAENSGFMWDIAPEFNALLVFAEHRYYGDSLPFGKNSTSKDPLKVGYLSSSQALADYADLITSLKATVPGSENSPVIVFGGSYGGMLAAWFRTKFPHIVAGAIAASAPIAQFSSPCDAFGRIVTSDFSAAAPNNSCSDAVRASWEPWT